MFTFSLALEINENFRVILSVRNRLASYVLGITVTHISQRMRKFMCTDEFFCKIGHINVTKMKRKWTFHYQAFNLEIKTPMKTKAVCQTQIK